MLTFDINKPDSEVYLPKDQELTPKRVVSALDDAIFRGSLDLRSNPLIVTLIGHDGDTTEATIIHMDSTVNDYSGLFIAEEQLGVLGRDTNNRTVFGSDLRAIIVHGEPRAAALASSAVSAATKERDAA